jgi:hypothetical protein
VTLQLTFLLAIVGYAGLTATALLAAHGRMPVRFWRIVTLVIVAHVALVWTVRYEWRFALAVRNGYAGFVVFHAALAMIAGSLLASRRTARVDLTTVVAD